jgi:hypothetical protein
MDVDLDIAVKTILQKNAETSDFIRLVKFYNFMELFPDNSIKIVSC